MKPYCKVLLNNSNNSAVVMVFSAVVSLITHVLKNSIFHECLSCVFWRGVCWMHWNCVSVVSVLSVFTLSLLSSLPSESENNNWKCLKALAVTTHTSHRHTVNYPAYLRILRRCFTGVRRFRLKNRCRANDEAKQGQHSPQKNIF